MVAKLLKAESRNPSTHLPRRFLRVPLLLPSAAILERGRASNSGWSEWGRWGWLWLTFSFEVAFEDKSDDKIYDGEANGISDHSSDCSCPVRIVEIQLCIHPVF